ncbi:50S ribosomal protein L10 [Caminibacter mediatlanticus TB-2]|uniref:Large ribosomal subunit protein uL10 n=1 Tax=Caminibacter mediatlanticus TB-2 TaxID=391592 RepID=A0AAI9F1V6_9BACT|nr:50S ribosomal protein L10 [Caminibacter mediatlanticus]EDM23149.1 50S ribosomal protein L10 [Caminibacter mediatlanticus TB-2]QCT93649.1 50S ribosomal protein L10 [Caminibacter mediatlanticus TB-2]
MKKELKKQIIEELSKEFTSDVSIFYADYKGQTVKDLETLRKSVREAGGKARVVKNTLARIALKNNGIEADFEENNIFIWGEDQITLAKIVVKHAKDYKDTFKIKGAVVEGEVKDAAYIEEVSKLPTKDELLGMVAFMMKAPIAKFAWGLNKLIEKKEQEN